MDVGRCYLRKTTFDACFEYRDKELASLSKGTMIGSLNLFRNRTQRTGRAVVDGVDGVRPKTCSRVSAEDRLVTTKLGAVVIDVRMRAIRLKCESKHRPVTVLR